MTREELRVGSGLVRRCWEATVPGAHHGRRQEIEMEETSGVKAKGLTGLSGYEKLKDTGSE